MSSTGKEGGNVAALYIRVSTLDQAREGYSLAAQQAALEAWAAQKGYATHLYADEGISGKDIDHRPAMRQILADVEAGKIAVVAVWALSRLTRSVADLYATWELLAAHGVGLVSHTEGFDTGSPTGRAMMGLLGVFAQMEREITAERVRAAMEERAAQGKRTCHSVLGYDLDGSDSLVPNPQEAEIIRYIFSKYLEHKSLSAVAELCRIKGYHGKRGREMCAWSVKLILTRPIYAGYNSWHGQLIRGSHEPLVSVADFNRVQRLLANPATGRKAKRPVQLLNFKNGEKGN